MVNTMENKYKEGETVYAKADPSLPLVIRRYVDRVYYCTVKNDSTKKEQVYYERELTENITPTK